MDHIPAESARTFISYAREDAEFVLKLACDLRQAGAAIWIDQLDIPDGARWDREVEAALISCPRLLVVLTPASVASEEVMDEVSYALSKKKVVLPCVQSDCEIPYRLHRFQRIDIRNGIANLLRVFGVAAASVDVAITPPVAIPAGTVKLNPKDGLEYVWIPPGEFLMGATPGDLEAFDDEKPQHQVWISKGFWLGKTPVTVSAYKRFVKETGHAMPEPPSFNPGWAKEDHPIVNVLWEDAQPYGSWAGMRLPTEAEWEYAARGGKEGLKYPWGNELSSDCANYDSKHGGTTHFPMFPPQNDWGLHDMAGNVWEWVADNYGVEYYKQNEGKDPGGPANGDYRVMRGGAWNDIPQYVRVSSRYGDEPSFSFSNCGFRCGGELR